MRIGKNELLILLIIFLLIVKFKEKDIYEGIGGTIDVDCSNVGGYSGNITFTCDGTGSYSAGGAECGVKNFALDETAPGYNTVSISPEMLSMPDFVATDVANALVCDSSQNYGIVADAQGAVINIGVNDPGKAAADGTPLTFTGCNLCGDLDGGTGAVFSDEGTCKQCGIHGFYSDTGCTSCALPSQLPTGIISADFDTEMAASGTADNVAATIYQVP